MRQGDEHIGRLQLRIVDGRIRDDHVAVPITTAGAEAVGLGLHHVAVVAGGRHGEHHPDEDHALLAGAAEAHLHELPVGEQPRPRR